jgi:hypothetical protein
MPTGFTDRSKSKSRWDQSWYTVQPNITATAGGGQSGAVPLTAQNCFISVCATAGDSVKLPASQPGMEIAVINQSATLTGPNVFPFGTEQINALGASNPIAVAPSTVMIFYCGIAGQWFTK